MSTLKPVAVSMAFLSLCGVGVVRAQDEPKWSYVEAGQIDFDPDSGSSDSGGYIAGSLRLFKNFHLGAEYDDAADFTLTPTSNPARPAVGPPSTPGPRSR